MEWRGNEHCQQFVCSFTKEEKRRRMIKKGGSPRDNLWVFFTSSLYTAYRQSSVAAALHHFS
jgi:hypothetical protein